MVKYKCVWSVMEVVTADEIKRCIAATVQSCLSPSPPAPGLPPPAPGVSDLLTFLLKQACQVPKGAGSCSTHTLQISLEETSTILLSHLKTSLQADDGTCMLSIAEDSPWYPLSRLLSTHHKHVVPCLYQFSTLLCTVLSAHVHVAQTTSHCDVTALFHTFNSLCLLEQLTSVLSELELDPNPHWSRCLATTCVCLVASEVCEMVRGVCGNEEQQCLAGGGELVTSLQFLNKHFPTALYDQYRKWEGQEVGGVCELVELGEGGAILKVSSYSNA